MFNFTQTTLVLVSLTTACGPEPLLPFEIRDQDWESICGDACAGPPVDVEVGEGTSCIRYEGGAVLCWGIRRGIDDSYSIEGWDGAALPPSEPRPQIALVGYDENDPDTRPGILDAIDLGVHTNNACVVRRDGTLWCWGRNEYNILMLGNVFGPQKWPVQAFVEETGFAQVDVGRGLCGITEEGRLKASIPTWLGETFATQCAPGESTTCLIRDGHVFCQGSNVFGALGDGSEEPHRAAVQAVGLENIVQVAVGNAHGCAVERNGNLWCWGRNDAGQVGRETDSPGENGRNYRYPTPALVSGLSDIIQVAAGLLNTCAIQQGGQLFCWGDDGGGVLGTGDFFGTVPTPVLIPGANDIIDVSIAITHGCAIRENGEVACWGSSNYGAIGPEPGRVPYGQLQSVRGLPHHGDWPAFE